MNKKNSICIYVLIILISIIHFFFAIFLNNACPPDMEWRVFQELTIHRWYVAVAWMSIVVIFHIADAIKQMSSSKSKRTVLLRVISIITAVLDFTFWTFLVIGVTM